MKRTFTQTFVCTIPLKVTPANERHLLVRLDCARMVYNACLGKALQRLRIMQQSPGYREAYEMPRHAPKRMKAFDTLRLKYDFTEYALQAFAGQFVHSWINEHLESRTIYKLASRAYRVAKRYSFSRIGKPRFKRKGELNSVESQTNKSGIIWREDHVKWWGLELPAMIDREDPVIAHGLRSRVKCVRIVRRQLNGRNRFYAQLLCEGKPYRKEKNKIGQGVVGLDLGPSKIAIVTQDATVACLERFCDELETKDPIIKRLQRKLHRQRRANNLQNFKPNRTYREGKQQWDISKRHQRTHGKLAEVYRKQSQQRRSLHGQLINCILSYGDTIKFEKLSYRYFQKIFGKTVQMRSPGLFVSELKRKANDAGAKVIEFPTRSTKLSRVCLCGTVKEKGLALRWHICDCGIGPIQRDIFSAWLATFVENGKLDADQARLAWSGVDARLQAASRAIQPAMGQGNPPNPAMGQSRSSVQSDVVVDEARVNARGIDSGESTMQSEPQDSGS